MLGYLARLRLELARFPRLRALLLLHRRQPSCLHESHDLTFRVTMFLYPVLVLCKVEQDTDERNV